MRVMAIVVPIIWAIGLAVAVLRWQYRGRLAYFGLAAVALIATASLTLAVAPNYICTVLFAAVALAIGVVVMVVSRDADFLLTTYAHWVSRVLALATMVWWLAGCFHS